MAASTPTMLSRNLVSAQYYRNPKDPKAFAAYLEKNDFIKDINNEGETTNATYAKNLASLENFVMLMFDKDTTVEPKQSSWFAPTRSATKPIPLCTETKRTYAAATELHLPR